MFILPSGQQSSGYEIARSLRFNSADSAYLSRTFGTPTNRNLCCQSLWTKRCNLGATQVLFAAGYNDSNKTLIRFDSSDRLEFMSVAGGTVVGNLLSSAMYRDVAAHYHVFALFDFTNATAANRVKIWVNGQVITFSTVIEVSNTPNVHSINGVYEHRFFRSFETVQQGDGYLSETYFIDGQALDPSYFGYTDPNTHQWKPKKYTGSYGANGFYLDFSDNTSTTTLGYDRSGNNNHWTLNNFSVAAGADNDSLTDTPTNNFATLNRLAINPTALSNGNLAISGVDPNPICIGTFGITTGKWYWETISTNSNRYASGGIWASGGNTAEVIGYNNSFAWGYYFYNGYKFNNSNSGVAFGNTLSAVSDVLGVAFDADNGNLYFYKNGVLQGGGAAFTGLIGNIYFPAGQNNAAGGGYTTINFGQRPFAHTPPEGFKALCTKNLPTPTGAAAKPWEHFGIKLRAGTGAAATVTGIPFQPDLVWHKARSAAYTHKLFDVVRGATKFLMSDRVDAELTNATTLTAFNSDGYSISTSAGMIELNTAYVEWLFRAGGSAVTNTAGSITSQVSANTAAGFSIVSYTGTGVNATVGHGLGVVPKMVIVRDRDNLKNWAVYHATYGAAGGGCLNSTSAFTAIAGFWNNTAPTSTVFSIGGSPSGSWDDVNMSSKHIACCFAEIHGYSKIDSYTGNGSADGPFVYCGFKPRWILIKCCPSGGSGFEWAIIDTSRSIYNEANNILWANLADNESIAAQGGIDFVSNGFKIKTVSNWANQSGATYIFLAIAESPFKYSNAR